MELNELTKLLMLAAAAYGNRFEVNDATAKVWHRYLKEFALDVATRAFDSHIATQNWPPTPADIRNLIKEKYKLTVPSAEEAWGECLNLMRSYGIEKEKECLALIGKKNPIAEHAARQATWWRIGMTSYDELHFVQKDFVRAYNDRMERGERMEALGVTGPEREEARALLAKLNGNGIKTIAPTDHPALPSGDKA